MTHGITPAQHAALSALAPALDDATYLAGGVAVAIELHHRQSLDLDLFVAHDFDSERLAERLQPIVPTFRIVGRGSGTLHAEVEGVPVSILSYRYPLLAPPVSRSEVPVRVAATEDLVCMKLAAIAGRGAAKDFWDLDALLAHGCAGGELTTALDLFRQKFPADDPGHVIRSLAYFGDADAAPLPRGLARDAWEGIKKRMAERVKAL